MEPRDAEKPRTRREEYAEITRQAILDAARQLFREQGFFATRVDQIAERARVSPATVYAVAGGKQGLLWRLIDSFTTDPIVAATIEHMATLDDPRAVIAFVAEAVRTMREQGADLVRLMLTTAPHDKAVAEMRDVATARYRDSLTPIAGHLLRLGAVKPDIDLPGCVDVLWFYLGFSGLTTLVEENGWSYDRAAAWLAEETARSLLQPEGQA